MKQIWRLSMALLLLSGNAAAADGSYLPPAEHVDTTKFLPPPPAAGSATLAADRDIFERTRALKDSDRWQLAIDDDKLDTDALATDFSCAAGFTLNRRSAPRFLTLFDKVRADAKTTMGSGKSVFQRPRPLVGNDAPICTPRDKYAGSFSYPSGHEITGFSFALILAELVPDQAAAIAARGRSFGESRVICGVHWQSDIEAGRLAASTLVAALHGNAAFRAELDAARTELAQARRTTPAPDGGVCARQAAANRQPW
jgi:acid phosphatase (class A)